MHLLRVGGCGLCEMWSPQAGAVMRRDTPETFHIGSEGCSKDGFPLDPLEGRREPPTLDCGTAR